MTRATQNRKRSSAYSEHQVLSAALKWWKYLYYVHAESAISDETYDSLEEKLINIETNYE